ncbi:MAG TPA: hypothetical protein VFE05_04185 [Longimicrobiaceae bacterium]|nr:hypothetical protein [Longimicrobiaceae bacterium]
MPELTVPIKIFDPAVPFASYQVSDPGIDTWHDDVLVTRRALDHLAHFHVTETARLKLSGGMSMIVPRVEIGLQIGSIKIDKITALVVDDGHHDVLLGSSVFDRVFAIGQSDESEVRISTPQKDDPSALSVELYPVQMPIDLAKFEFLLRAKRKLYNLSLVAFGEVPLLTGAVIEDIINCDENIPSHLRLKLAWVDAGSIWLTLKSGSTNTLKYLASLFETGASAKLAQQVAEAQKAETEAAISQATRDATAIRLNEEQERLRIENVAKVYEVWRSQVLSHVNFLDEVLAKIEDPRVATQLRAQRDQAIAELVEQTILPVVRNIPRPHIRGEGPMLLGPGNMP